MKTLLYINFIFIFICGSLHKAMTQDSVNNNHLHTEIYTLKPAIDLPIIAVAGGWSYYALSKIYKKDSSSVEDILSLNKKNINGFDRWAADVYHPDAEALSDKLFFAAMPMPLVLLFDKEIRKDALKIAVLYTEALSITGTLYTSSTYLNRYRPSTYNEGLTVEQKRSGNQRNSFFAGHVALVATSTFFTAKIYSDYHPRSGFRWVLYGIAAGATGATGYLRHRAGKHFPTDIILGSAIGTLSGILVPQVHKIKRHPNKHVQIFPYTGESHGIAMIYKF
ncbi:MAG TPA: phosphatase PAP2 family protein [Flavitalea sp.]|nr:phosphatase PAP2 family protein [Flavitalea sp.]